MNRSQAMKEASRRWKKPLISDGTDKRVGYYQMGFFCVQGHGSTFEEAFALADKNAEAEKRQLQELKHA